MTSYRFTTELLICSCLIAVDHLARRRCFDYPREINCCIVSSLRAFVFTKRHSDTVNELVSRELEWLEASGFFTEIDTTPGCRT